MVHDLASLLYTLFLLRFPSLSLGKVEQIVRQVHCGRTREERATPSSRLSSFPTSTIYHISSPHLLSSPLNELPPLFSLLLDRTTSLLLLVATLVPLKLVALACRWPISLSIGNQSGDI